MNLPLFRSASRALRYLLAAAVSLTALQAHALPSFARQTGQDCGACHIGSFGPQLTPYGQRFKLGGYTDGDNRTLALSAMLVGQFTQTAKDQSEAPAKHFDTNDNAAIQEVSAFLGGGLTDHLGSFAQVTYSGIDRKAAWDNLDVRYARPLTFQGKDLITGLSLNNNPGVQDPFNTLPVWGFPYLGSDLAPEGAPAAPLLAGGLETQVLGANAFAFFDDRWYAELGGYRSLGHSTLDALGVPAEDIVKASGISPYLRLAYTRDVHAQSMSVGMVGMSSNLEVDDTGRTDRYRDVGVDASYQYLGTRRNIFTVNALALHESQSLSGSRAVGDAEHSNLSLNSYNLNAAYYYHQHYGVTAGYFATNGDADAGLYADSSSNRPDTRGETLQLDYTPFGSESSWMAPNVNLRLGLQFTRYDRYAGGADNYDGSGRGATDNNTLLAFVWAAL
ncbi:cytochrome C [Sinimarinibacterium sp. CAU 1509]|uniref:cytochrome C n=1 Tax=Sinimarinibacterium sp. CAU 1509 TaxID=2562283 RepID=UPI0010ACD56C|nr:cytochrome C [Sinimarinibacterium sp. CAU 1509]TJY61988.1 cytochrome C [Sinimarinibacterium sp. CAU 1509]